MVIPSRLGTDRPGTDATHREATTAMTARQGLWLLISVSSALRLLWAACLGPGNDEAYHYLYTVHPDWSYFDHPPLIALVEAVGLALLGGVHPMLGLRLGFVATFAASTWLMHRLAARFYGPRAGLLAAFLLNVTGYFGGAVATFALPGGPLLFFWLLTLDRLAAALAHPDRTRPWAWVGLAWGGALLSKYHAVFLPVGALAFLLADPPSRAWLRRPGPYLATAVGLLCFAPVLWWNAGHGWASFAFQGGRAMAALRPRPEALAAALGGQALYLFPWLWAPLVAVLLRGLRSSASGCTADRFLICQAAPPLLAFAAVACVRPILPHWPLIGFVAAIPLLAHRWADRLDREPRFMRRRLAALAALPVTLAALGTAHAHTGLAQREGDFLPRLRLVPAAWDPTLDVHGWDQVARELGRRGLLHGAEDFLFTGQWYHSGQLALATRGSDPVLCYNPRRAQGFAYWSRPEDWVGRDGILVAVDPAPGTDAAAPYAGWFERIEPLGDVAVTRGGAAVRRVALYRCLNQIRPFPFDNGGRRPAVAAGYGG